MHWSRVVANVTLVVEDLAGIVMSLVRSVMSAHHRRAVCMHRVRSSASTLELLCKVSFGIEARCTWTARALSLSAVAPRQPVLWW